jgi:hypothetical protein
MPLESLSPAAFAFIVQVDEAYAALTQRAPQLGGKLFYAGNLMEPACAAIVAANIAGAATLAASADRAAAKQAMRAGQVDFVVNSLDEALRILKNQVRTGGTAAVCVTAEPKSIEREIEARGVQPDLFFPDLVANFRRETHTCVWLTWRASQSPALWLPKLDAIALGCLDPDAIAAQRWIERAPRYLGRIAQNLRILHTTQQHADQCIAQLKANSTSGDIHASIEIEIGPWGNSVNQSLFPTGVPSE